MQYSETYENLKKTLLSISIVLLLVSCDSAKQRAPDEMAPLYAVPKTVALNTQEGYSINPVTGDSIEPIINSLGDTVKTGVPIPAIGKVIDPKSVAKPRVIPAGKPDVVHIPQNVHKIPEALTVIPVDKSSLKTFTPGVDTFSFVLVNSDGDTVPTGVPIPVHGKVVPGKQPQTVKALPPRMRENAIINIKYLDMEQGMSSSRVTSILKDSRGNFWFGTYDGVNMYNGESFIHFTQTESLSPNSVSCSLEDSHGNLWFGRSDGGISKYDGETYTNFTQKEGLSSNNIRSILEDSDGNLWFGTGGGGVSKYNGETFTHLTEKEGLCSNHVMTILEDSHGNLWFGTKGGGVSKYDGDTFTHFTQKEGLCGNNVSSILEDSHGNLWFGTFGGGVSKYDGENLTHFTQKEGLCSNNVNSILEDSHGNLWFGTYGGGASKYNGKTFTHITENEGLSSNNVYSILEDSLGNLWFATDGGGVSIYFGETFTHFTKKEGLSNNLVHSILEDSHENLWFGNWGGGVSLYNGETFTQFATKEGLSDSVVNSILEDRNGNLWFGTWQGGVSMYNGETFTHFTQKEGLIANPVWSILEDSHGNLWFGTGGGGISRYDGKTFTHFTENEGLSNNTVFSMLEDRNGILWFGTQGGGVSMYNGETFTHLTEKEGLSDNHVMTILEDSHGNLWFGTKGGGVSKYDGDTFTHFTQKEGLCHNSVQSILEDNNNNIWLSTSKGLNCLVFGPESISTTNKSLSACNPVIHTYGLQDGLKDLDFLLNSKLLDNRNRIWWGNIKNIVMLDLNNLKIPVEPPATMQLNRIDINGQSVDYRHLKDSNEMKTEFTGVARFYNYPLHLELPYNQNHLTFHFSAIDWSAPHKIRYSYKMEGLDDKWSSPTSEAKAEYRNLVHDTYTFKVRAIGAAQKWSEPFEYTFAISPPWWHTLWARTGYVIIAFLLIYGIIRWRTARLKRSQRELEQKVKERTTEIQDKNEELRQQQEELQTINEILENQKEELLVQQGELQHQKEELQVTLENLKTTQSQLVQSEKMASIGQLVAGIAHEINNPVTFISAGVDSLNTNLDEVRQVLDIYHRITLNNVEEKLIEIEKLKEKIEYNEAILEINKLIDSVKTGTERTTEIVKGLRTFSRLDEDVLKIADIHDGINSTLILLRNKYKQRIEINKHYGNIPEIECYPGQLNQVFMNILSNAIDAIDEKGSIIITTSKSNSSVKISIKDTGRGIPEEIQSKIFEPFFTTKEVGRGTGLGLSICHSIIEKHRGSIDVKCEDGNGSEFVILLPVKQSKK